MDQADLILENKTAIQSPSRLWAYKSPLGLIIGGLSQERPSKSGQKIIEQLITNSINSSQHAVTSFTTTCSNSSRVYQKNLDRNSGEEADTSSLLNPAETVKSFSENTDGSAKKEKKRFDKDEQRTINFDLSLFWKLENFANLDGADAEESDKRFDSFADEITRLTDGRYCTPIPWKTDKWRLQRNLKNSLLQT